MKIFFNRLGLYMLFYLCFIMTSCSDESDVITNNPVILDEFTTGPGFFEYSSFNNKVMRVFYHIPSNANTNTQILFVFHGNGRNAKDYRDAMVSKANQYGCIVMTPEFSQSNFPGGDAYNLGNVFIDGDNPSPDTLNSEAEWAFSVIEPLFDFIKQSLNNSTSKYHIFGHSAGGQFAHRLVMFKSSGRFDKIVASASGWYTDIDVSIAFPYGLRESPLGISSLSSLFEKSLMIQVGNLDNDPNAAGLRHNEYADAQGLNRFDRAQHFFNKASGLSSSIGGEFHWELHINQGADHNYEIASQYAADLIFN